MDKVYKFQILLPNETTVHLQLRNPEPKMPFGDFIRRVKDEYDVTWRQSDSLKRKRDINWKAHSFYLLDVADRRITDVVIFKNFKPHECHILSLQDDDLQNRATTFQDMWDLTPDTDKLKELPEEYTFETALADLIDNSLQAVWSNEKHVKHISVDVSDDIISIFDTGPGMDGTGENSIEKWGKMGASPHRKFKREAIGGTPPYLKPFFGMFGYGGPLASMKLGRRAIVSSKTKESKKVYTLNLDRDTILKGSNWKTVGGMREPQEAEISRTPSFTKVEIAEPRSQLDIYNLQCKLKDVYFPYIQYDEESKSGKKIMPVQFEVNGVNLVEVQGGETAMTNLHSCNGPNFVFQLQLSRKKDDSKANARLKCVYFPVSKGKENIERILEGLESEGCRTTENFESFSRISIRRLGRLLPDVRWALLPFMDLKPLRGDTADMLKRCCMRVKCFIETDAGFNPNPSKTHLAQHCPFTAALKNLGNKILETEKDVEAQIYRDGDLLNPIQLKRDYESWILQMHERYDDIAAGCGQDNPANKTTVLHQEVHGTTNHLVISISEVAFSADTRINANNLIEHEHEVKVVKITNSIFGMGSGCTITLNMFWKRLYDFVEENPNHTLETLAEHGFEYIKTDKAMNVRCGFYLISIENGKPKVININNSKQEHKKTKETLTEPGCYASGSGAGFLEEIKKNTTELVLPEIAEKAMLTAALSDPFTGGIISVYNLSQKGISESYFTVLELLQKYYGVLDQLLLHNRGKSSLLAISDGQIPAASVFNWFCKGRGIKNTNIVTASIIGKLLDKRIWFLAFGDPNPDNILNTIRKARRSRQRPKNVESGKKKPSKIEQELQDLFTNCCDVEIDTKFFSFAKSSPELVDFLAKHDLEERKQARDFEVIKLGRDPASVFGSLLPCLPTFN